MRLILCVILFWLIAFVPAFGQKQIKIGESVNLPGCTFMVKQFKYKKYVGTVGVTAKASGNGTFLIATVEVKNTTKKAIMIDNADITLIDMEGNTFEYSPEATAAIEVYGSKTFFMTDINPGITATAKVVFEVPDKKRQYRLMLKGIAGKEYVLVILDKPVSF